MRVLFGIILVLTLSACGTPTGEETGNTTTGNTTTGDITIGEPWVRTALLMGEASGMAMGEASASGMAMEASASAEAGGMEGHNMDPSASGMAMDGAVSAGYMTLRNDGAEADRLLEASSDVAGDVQLHTSEMNNNVMSMRQVEAIEVPAGETVALEPGGLHLMFLDLKSDLKAGETVAVTLRFERAGTMEIEMPVRAPAE